MDFVLSLGILLVLLCEKIFMELGKNRHAFAEEELEQMARESCGKSKAEARRILKKYEKR